MKFISHCLLKYVEKLIIMSSLFVKISVNTIPQLDGVEVNNQNYKLS